MFHVHVISAYVLLNVCVRLTQVVIVHHCIGASEAWALLGEMIPKLQQRGVFLQHAGYLHLYLVA